jgi:hypothetical protein
MSYPPISYTFFRKQLLVDVKCDCRYCLAHLCSLLIPYGLKMAATIWYMLSARNKRLGNHLCLSIIGLRREAFPFFSTPLVGDSSASVCSSSSYKGKRDRQG